MKPSIITFTSPVSDLTYCGHPGSDENLVDCSPREVPWSDTKIHWKSPNTDPVKTLIHLKNLLREYNQPVTWIINDNEYTNLNGTLPYLKQFQQEGDSILVTFEIVQRPSPVDRKNTEEVLRYAHGKCTEVGLRIDGIWSLKFLNSDIEAILRLSKEFEWARNLAGACWSQPSHVDDAGWRGCPFGAYYPALNNIKGCQIPEENDGLVMMQWLTREFASIIQVDRMEPYGLDPADPSTPKIGGFSTEEEAGNYLASVVLQVLKNSETNIPNIIRIHEKVRMYFDEGHDKDIVIRKIYDVLNNVHQDRIKKTTLKEAYEIFRKENPKGTNSCLLSGVSLDKRYQVENIMLYEDGRYQIHFKKSIGNYLYRMYDYTSKCIGKDNFDYPVSYFPVIPYSIVKKDNIFEIHFELDERYATGKIYALALWDYPELNSAAADFEVKHLKSHDGNHVLLFKLAKGKHVIKLT